MFKTWHAIFPRFRLCKISLAAPHGCHRKINKQAATCFTYGSGTHGLKLVILVTRLLPAQIIDQDINADQENPHGQNDETPADVIAANQKNERQQVTAEGNPARGITTVDVEIMNTAAILMAYTFMRM